MSDPQQLVDVVLSAERLSVATRRIARERVRVRRVVVSEEVTMTVTVRREVLRVDREPAGSETGEFSASTPAVEIVLSEERPRVAMEVVPYERVRLQVQQVAATTSVTPALDREVAELLWDEQTAPRTLQAP